MNIYLALILLFLFFEFAADLVVNILNLKHLSPNVPEEFRDVFDPEKYEKSQNYLRDRTRYGFVLGSCDLLLILGMILGGGFNLIDLWARRFGLNVFGTGLLFVGALALLMKVFHLPFGLYQTFVTEERYGFNRTTLKTYFLDILKGTVLTILIGAPVFCLILWFFESLGGQAWLWAMLALALIQIFLVLIAPVWIMPLFNKFTPLEEGDLRTRIEEFCLEQDFKIQGVFRMDGSKRSSKANAYFIGFGRFKRIVLLDTLIEKHTVPELVSVLAHEIGHYKMRHIQRRMALTFLFNGLQLYLLSLFIKHPGLFEAFGMAHLSTYASFVFFGLLYTPISMILGVFSSTLSRTHEYEADRYAVQTRREPRAMVSALKKLSADTLSNLTPHPLKVMLEYSHPPVLERIGAINGMRG